MEEVSKTPRKKSGRPLSFDRDAALERAMLVFWRFGYEAASLQELTSAMGITPPSLYAAFGDKEKLYLEAIERYASRNCDELQCLFEQAPTARDAIERFLQSIAVEMTCPSHPPGCLVASSAMNCSASAAHVQEVVSECRDDVESRIRDRLDKALVSGELPAGTNTAVLAAFFNTIIQGLSTQARDTGGDRDQLLAIVKAAMQAWPGK